MLFGLQAQYRGILIWIGRPAGDKLLCFKQGNLRAVLLQEPEQVLGFEPYGGGIVIGVYTDQAGALQKGLIQPEGHLVFPVIEQAQRCHRAGDQAKHIHQILIRGKGKRPGVVLLPEGFQVDSLVPLDRNEIVITLFVIPNEEVLGVGLRVAKCSLEHGGVPFCWECPEYPCPRYEGFDDGDSFVPHRNRQQDIAQAREVGLDTYLAQLEEKRAILDKLLAYYNGGRRKTFFNTAFYLLPLEDLRSVMASLDSQPELSEQAVKERALAAVELLQEAADRRGISLKLNKKPKKG